MKLLCVQVTQCIEQNEYNVANGNAFVFVKKTEHFTFLACLMFVMAPCFVWFVNRI